MTENKDKTSAVLIPEEENKAVMNYKLTKKSALGMFYVAIGSLFGSLMASAVSYISSTYKINAPTITFTRSLVNLVINLCFCAFVKVNPVGPYKEGGKFMWVILRGLFGGIQITCYFFAFTKIPVGDATTLTFIAPVLTGLLAIWMLNESWGLFDAIATTLCFVGVIFVAKPSAIFHEAGKSLDLYYVSIAFLGSLAASIAYIAVRKVGPTVSVFVLINYILLFTMAINIFQAEYKLKKFPWPNPHTSLKAWMWLCSTGVLGVGAQTFINRGLQLEKAGPATSMRFMDIVFSYFWQVFLLHQSVDAFSLVGALLVSLCLILIGFKKWWYVRKARIEYEKSIQQ